MNTQHTPGPWIVTQVPTAAGSAFRIGTAGAEKSCTWIYADGIRKGIDDELPRAQELAANARLIAAAPDLLNALQELFGADMAHVLMGDGKPDQIEAIANARAAIAKATGVSS